MHPKAFQFSPKSNLFVVHLLIPIDLVNFSLHNDILSLNLFITLVYLNQSLFLMFVGAHILLVYNITGKMVLLKRGNFEVKRYEGCEHSTKRRSSAVPDM